MLSGFAKVAETLPFLFPCLAYRLVKALSEEYPVKFKPFKRDT